MVRDSYFYGSRMICLWFADRIFTVRGSYFLLMGFDYGFSESIAAMLILEFAYGISSSLATGFCLWIFLIDSMVLLIDFAYGIC